MKKNIKFLHVFFLSFFILGCAENYPSDSDVVNALSAKDPLAIAQCREYTGFQRKNGYKQNEKYTVEYVVILKTKKTIDECTETIKEFTKNKPEMALSVFQYMMENMFEMAALSTYKEKEISGAIEMIKSESGWIESP